MRTLIKNGTIVTDRNEFIGEVLIEDEKIKTESPNRIFNASK